MKAKIPLISAIITTYNRRSYFKGALASVLAQDYPEMEVIVIDDGSTDGSEEEVRHFPVKYIYKENGGISSARNKGIAVSKGDYLAFLDVDDLWLKGKLSTQMALMKDGDYKISYTDEIWIRNGKRINQKKRHRKQSGWIFPQCLPLCIISPSSALISREVFDTVGNFDETLPACEDYDMWLRITCRYPVLFIEKPLIRKTGGHEDQLSRKYEAMDRFRVQGLVKVIKSGVLTEDLREKALEELKMKCGILALGARKRGKEEEAREYLEMAEGVGGEGKRGEKIG
ncbi:MAG TPA: glycosyltransferase [Syntrophorhabdaceae bacterium]|jgi:glycosyltransferase involved in cell wall biosynthesis